MAKRGLKRSGRLKRQAKQPKPKKPQADLPTKGQHHDLIEIYEAVNQQYFNGEIRARITWGRKLRAPQRDHQSIKMGMFYTTTGLITIHRRLDSPWVPRFFVEYIVFHEMLHEKHPPQWKNGHCSFHYPEFMAAEKNFLDIAKAVNWEEKNLDRLLFF